MNQNKHTPSSPENTRDERPQLWEEMGKVWDDVSTFGRPQLSVIVYDGSSSGGFADIRELYYCAALHI